MFRTLALAGVCTLALAAPSLAAVTFTSAQVNSNALSSATSPQGTGDGSGSDADMVTALTPSLDASSQAIATRTSHLTTTATASANEDASATFTSAASGTITFTGMTSEGISDPNDSAQAQDDGEYYMYHFTVTTPSTFNLTYFYGESYAGVNNSFILSNLSDFTTVGQLQSNGDTSGMKSYTLAAGDYAFGASTEYGDFSSQTGAGSAGGGHMEAYTFDITSAAPEPATWAMMVAGVGLIGGALRRERHRAGAAAA